MKAKDWIKECAWLKRYPHYDPKDCERRRAASRIQRDPVEQEGK